MGRQIAQQVFKGGRTGHGSAFISESGQRIALKIAI